MLNQLLNQLKPITKSRDIKSYNKNMSEERLLSALSENNLDNGRIIKIREDSNKLKHEFFQSEINKI